MRSSAHACGLAVALLLAASTLTACSEPNALLLSISASRRVETFDLVVRDLDASENVAETAGQAIPAEQDISQEGQELKLAVRFQVPGVYLVHVVGNDPAGTQVAVQSYRVEGAVEAQLELVPLDRESDADMDGFPSVASCEALASPSLSCEAADCDDDDPRTNPVASERCNGKDDDCDGALPPVESDVDGDGYLGCTDCNPNDETDFSDAYLDCDDCDDARADVHPASRRDPLAYPAAAEDCHNCGDGVDHDCDGQLTACHDGDCDGWAGCGEPTAAPPPECDCADDDPARYPGATEICGDQIDNNCDGNADEGCLPCDLDGDGFLRDDPSNGCVPAADAVDCDDTDAGIFPGAAESCGGSEAGCPAMALREYCGDRDTLGQPVIHDCVNRTSGVSGCPPEVCDRDGDGYVRHDPDNGCNPAAGAADCNDDDPRTFPGAPDHCGDGVAQNCNLDAPCANDTDGDGYNDGDDCDAGNAAVHPFATELCNGVDDDCDGLVDEGNPDSSTGASLSGVACTDSDYGECGAHPGMCVCSRTVPVATRDPVARQVCPDEDLGAAASPRCFGAGQPVVETAQTCDGLDQNCNGVGDDAPGEVPCAVGTACGDQGTSTWKCLCGPGSGCDGCCLTGSPADTCVGLALVSVAQCGQGGEACRTCDDGSVCTLDSCDGSCHNDNRPDGYACPGGQCRWPASGGPAVCCATCWLGESCAAASDAGCGEGGANCAAVGTGCGLCRMCDGAGLCGVVPAGQDPNAQCADQGASSCGQNGFCNGSGGCALYASGTACATCKVCNGSGQCNNVAEGLDPNSQCPDDGGCGRDGVCDGDGACRFYPSTKTCGTCRACDGAGACARTPADDSACGTILCNGLDEICRDYHSITTNRCLSFGVCKPPNDPATCISYTNTDSGIRCALCKVCDGGGGCDFVPEDSDPHGDCGVCNTCDGAAACKPAGDEAPCGTCHWCQGGSCDPVPDANTSCGTCQVCVGGSCDPVGSGEDPNNDCGTCQVCNGGGSCTVAADGTDPKDLCASQICCQGACCNHTCCDDGCCTNNSACSAQGLCQ